MLLNTNRGIIKAMHNNRVVIQLPRGGTFKWKTDRVFKIGEEVCFTVDTVLQKITDVIPSKEADDIVQVAEAEAWGVDIGGINGLDLSDEDSDYEFENDNLEYLEEEDPIDEHNLDNTGHRLEGSVDFGCGEHRNDVIEGADYIGGPTQLPEPDGTTD